MGSCLPEFIPQNKVGRLVVLFTLLVQGLSTKWFLNKLDLIGDQPLRQEYSELLTRRVALQRVLNYLVNNELPPEIVTEEYYRYQLGLVKGELQSIEKKIEKMNQEHENLRSLALEQLSLALEQLQEQLLDIEADTYAEFIRASRLQDNLSPLLQGIMVKADQQLLK